MGSKRNVPMRDTLSRRNLVLKGIPAEYIDATVDDFVENDDTKDLIARYIDNMHDMYEDRVCLAFYGANGTGKTYLSSIIIKEAYRRRYNSHMTTLAHYMDLCFNPKKTPEIHEELKCISDAEFLVLDEVGKENFTKTQSNVNLLEELLRQSVVKGQVVIICSNLPLEDVGGVEGLYSLYGNSVKSLIEGDFVKLEFNLKDYRPKVLRKKRGIQILQGED